MNILRKLTHFLSFCLISIILSSYVFAIKNVEAKDLGIGRIRSCSGTDGKPEGLDFNPTTGGKDVEFVLDNPVCISVIATTYTAVKIGIARMNYTCGINSPTRIAPTPLLDSIDITRATLKAGTGNLACAQALAEASAIFATAVGVLGGIYLVADRVFDDAKICGSDWKLPNKDAYQRNIPGHKGVVENKVNEWMQDPVLAKQNLNFDNKTYREWYYGGVEVEYDGCKDVTQNSAPGVFGVESYPPQQYYLKGYEVGNFNCEKYDILPGMVDPRDGSALTPERFLEYRQAYNCCVDMSLHHVCIRYQGENKFCKAGERCEIKGIHFEAESRDNNSRICAKTYSLCPYNFNLQGGADVCDYFQDGIEVNGRYEFIKPADVEAGDCVNKSEIRNEDCTYNEKAGRCKNYCQFMSHCTKTNSVYKYRSSLHSPYYSTACINFAGDSQNRVSYGTGFIAGSARHFSTPIAQCVKETLENLFLNRAGHTRCLLNTDTPNSNGECANGVAYSTGDKVENRSFFETIQGYLLSSVKMVLTLSIVFMGVKILLGGQELKKSEILMYVVKFGIVVFFVSGTAWQNFFFEGVYNASNIFSQIVFKIQMPDDENRRDGCQFGIVTDSQGNPMPTTRLYPQGKEYLAIWDTIDCKIARYLGFGPEVSVANIAKLILAGYITGSAGIYFAKGLLFFGIMLISIAIKALHIFVGSAVAIILMIFVSPITITAAMFSKTESIFKGWLKQIIGFALQPMILFAYIAIFISIMDKTLTGSATFYGPGPVKTINCSKYCANSAGNKVPPEESPECDRTGEEFVNPKADSFACLITVDEYSKWPGLEILGISLPFILEIFQEDAKKKILTILKAALIMYFLDKFMTEVPGIAVQLVGGGKLPLAGPSAGSMLNATGSLLRGIQKRGGRAGKKALKGSARKAGELAKHAVSDAAKGKAVNEDVGGESADSVGRGGAEGDSSGKSESGGDSGGSKKISGGDSGSSEA